MSPGSTKFGAFELDNGQRLLRRDGAEVHLTPKAFDLLDNPDVRPAGLPNHASRDKGELVEPAGNVTRPAS
jgi:hypothetical protein